MAQMFFAMAMVLLAPHAAQEPNAAGRENGTADAVECVALGGGATEPALAGIAPEVREPRSEDLLERHAAALGAFGGRRTLREAERLADAVYFGRFLDLAHQGELRAALWCLEPRRQGLWLHDGLSRASARASRLALWRVLLQHNDVCNQALVSAGVLGWLAEEVVLGHRDARLIAADFARCARSAELQAWALYAEARLLAPWNTVPGAELEQALRVLNAAQELGSRDAKLKQLIDDALFRLLSLSVGSIAPNFCTYDPHGNEVCLEDLRGQVVLVRFFSFGQPGIRQLLGADALRVRRYWDERFLMVGINTDLDSAELTRHSEASDTPWPNAWEADHKGSAATAWHIDGWTTILLDQVGRVVAVDPAEETLATIIEGLLPGFDQQPAGGRHESPVTDLRPSLSDLSR